MSLLGGDPSPAPPPPPRALRAPAKAPVPASRWTRGELPGEVGIWIFIFGDMLVFAVFFGVFMVQRGADLEAFRAGRESLMTAFGAINTLLLLTGSLLVALAMRAVRAGRHDLAPRLVLGAMATGAVFTIDKGLEYADKLDAGLTPSSGDFYTLFFVFTGIHLLHLLVGMGALVYLRALAGRPDPPAQDVGTMESCASYWHLVDLLWVVLFALFYLVA